MSLLHRGRTGPVAIALAALLIAASCGTVDDYVSPTVDNRTATTSGSEGSDGETGSDSTTADGTPSSSDTGGGDGTTATTGPDAGSATTQASETSLTSSSAAPDSGPTLLVPRIINTFPHDASAFTQGLELLDGVLFESTGLYGSSSRRRVGLTNGLVSGSVPLDESLFGGGLTITDDGTIVQLTWREGVAILADSITMQEFERFSYSGEGWGICADTERLVMSDGSAVLTFRDPMSFSETGTVTVTRRGEPVPNLNELECVGTDVWANVWLTDEIVRIDPTTGTVTAVVDVSSLVPSGLGSEDVLNGIAFNPDAGTFLLTGKRWNVLYEVEFVES